MDEFKSTINQIKTISLSVVEDTYETSQKQAHALLRKLHDAGYTKDEVYQSLLSFQTALKDSLSYDFICDLMDVIINWCSIDLQIWKDEKDSLRDYYDRCAKQAYENDWICVHDGTCKGQLIGGNLNTMEGFFGTTYMPEIKKGDILFIEDSLKDACTIERSFSLLKLAGVFDKVSGIILGKHEKFDDNGTGRKPYEILLEVMQEVKIPILAEFDCCHTHPMFTLPIGCMVQLDATNKKVELMEDPFQEN